MPEAGGYCPRSGKVGHADAESARRHLRKWRKTAKSSALSIYRCRTCGLWHIGNHQLVPRGRKRGRPQEKRRKMTNRRGGLSDEVSEVRPAPPVEVPEEVSVPVPEARQGKRRLLREIRDVLKEILTELKTPS